MAAIPLMPDEGRPAVAIFRSPIFNASETFVQEHAAALRRYRPICIGLEDKGNASPELRHRIVVPRSVAEALGFRLGVVREMARRLRADPPVLIHAHFATDGLLALPLARTLGVPLVTTLHGYDVSRSRRGMLASGRLSWMRLALLRRRLMRQGDRFLAVSDAVCSRAASQGYPAGRTRTHYLGVNLGRFRPDAAAPEPGTVLHVGRLVEKKGTAVLLRAMVKLPEARLVVIGEGPERSALQAQAQARSLRGRVSFLGALPPSEVAAWMRRAWVLAAPSVVARDGDAEGLPTVIVEAAASGLPAVGTDHSGIPEAIVDGETGFLVPEGDAGALAARLRDILASPGLRQRLGAGARALAEQRFDSGLQGAKLELLYDELLRQMRPRLSK